MASTLAKLAVGAGLLLAANASPVEKRQEEAASCPEFPGGTFVIDQYALYPENADWDPERCVLVMGALFNSTVAIYDPYEHKMEEILTFNGITQNPAFHIGGVNRDRYTGNWNIVVDAGAAFVTGGEDISGDNYIMEYNPDDKEILWFVNITDLTQGEYSGFQDIEKDSRGNTYVVGTFPSSIVRVSPGGEHIIPWYRDEDANAPGFSGLAAIGDILLTNDASAGMIYRFDMGAEEGTPIPVPMTPDTRFDASDAILLPPKYGGRVLLVAEDNVGVTVLRSNDGWETAEHLGTIPNDDPLADGFAVSATVQIGDEYIYMVEEFFADAPVEGFTAGSRDKFPMIDITDKIEALLAGEDFEEVPIEDEEIDDPEECEA